MYPDPKHPYYIVTPSYDPKSAGVRCLHLLCHTLNRAGQTAYIIQDPAGIAAGAPFVTGTDLLAPKLDAQIAKDHADRGKVPIVLYPETITGNPYTASVVARYVCNFPGLLAGDAQYAPGELVYGYSRSLAESAGYPDNVLFIPVTDTRIFKEADPTQVRQGTCFYADKYRKVHGGIPSGLTDDSVEITRHESTSQTTEEVAALFRRSELFYTYENTALAFEAVLCGCPAVFLPNPYLQAIIGGAELGTDGYAWGPDEAEIARARATVKRGRDNYLATIDRFYQQLDGFIAASQTHAARIGVPGGLTLPLVAAPRRYRSLIEAGCMETLKRAPSLVQVELGKLLSTLGFRRAGATIQVAAQHRTDHPTELRIAPRCKRPAGRWFGG